jgi:hypothetical protein
MTRPTRYTENGSTRDWIDEFCATSSAEEARGAFRFTIGKYLRRYGKKDDPLQEAIKIQDYANRLVEFERAQLAVVKKPFTTEPASLIDDESPRQKLIQQGGEMAAEVYREIDRMRAAEAFNADLPVTVEEAIALGAVPQREPCKPRHRCHTCAGGHATHLCAAGT